MPRDLLEEEGKQPRDLLANEKPQVPMNPLKPPKRSMDLSGSLDTLQNIGKVYPALETGANLATSAYGIPASGLAGLMALPFGLDTASKVQKKVQDLLVYQPHTKGGEQLTEATTYPLTKLEEAGGYAGGKLEEAGYPMVGAGVHSAIQASPLLLAARGGAKAKSARVEKKINAAIDSGVEKAIRPSVEGKRTHQQTQKYMGNAREAVKTIVENKDRLNLTDEFGEPTGKLPQNLKQFSQAVDQTKIAIFKEYDALAMESTGKGVVIDLMPIVNELKKIGNSKVIKDNNPQVATYALNYAERLLESQKYNPLEMQDAISMLNKRLDAFYKNPTYENASTASIDAMIANNLRKALDSEIEKSSGSGYQKLKNKYGSLKTIERDVNRRSIVDARKNIRGLIDFSDMLSGSQVVYGILSMNPALVGSGMASRAIASITKYINNPNRIVKTMFKDVDKALPTVNPIQYGGPNAFLTKE